MDVIEVASAVYSSEVEILVESYPVCSADMEMMDKEGHVKEACMGPDNHYWMVAEVGDVGGVDNRFHSENCWALGNLAVDHYKWRFPSKLDDQLV